MKAKVMKFGGTSVADDASRNRAASLVISAKEQGWRPVVVVSAIGRRGDPYATDTLLGMLRDIDADVAPDPREEDLMIACGEILSAAVFAQTLKTLGHASQAFRGGQAGIRTDGVYGNARIVSINPQLLLECMEAGSIPVVCGFQGTHVSRPGIPGGELTTLGRGGSDTTASAIAAAVGADMVEIYTDVDGVKTADPDFVPDAPTLRKVTYDEVAEIAHLGAKVVHPRAAEIAMKFGIPLWVKNTFSDEPGTEVVRREDFPGRRVTGVAHTGKLVYLQFDLADIPEERGYAIQARVYGLLARYGLNAYMMNHSRRGFGFALPKEHYPAAENLFDGLVLPVKGEPPSVFLLQIGEKPSKEAETQADLLQELGPAATVRIELTENCSIVSLVGHEYLQQPGVYLDVLETLHENQISVLQTSDSEFSLSCLVPEVDTERAVRLLHIRFGLSEAK